MLCNFQMFYEQIKACSYYIYCITNIHKFTLFVVNYSECVQVENPILKYDQTYTHQPILQERTMREKVSEN